MPKSLFKATAHLQSGTQVKVKASGFEITIDEPKESGGTDTGMNPETWGRNCAAKPRSKHIAGGIP